MSSSRSEGGGVGVWLHSFVAAVLVGGERSPLIPAPLFLWHNPSTFWIGGWVGPSVGLNLFEKRQMSWRYWHSVLLTTRCRSQEDLNFVAYMRNSDFTLTNRSFDIDFFSTLNVMFIYLFDFVLWNYSVVFPHLRLNVMGKVSWLPSVQCQS